MVSLDDLAELQLKHRCLRLSESKIPSSKSYTNILTLDERGEKCDTNVDFSKYNAENILALIEENSEKATVKENSYYDRIKKISEGELQLKCRSLSSESDISSSQSYTDTHTTDEPDDEKSDSNIDHLMNEAENILKLAEKSYKKATDKEKNYHDRIKKTSKELSHLRHKGKKLEVYISETNSYMELIEETKREIDSLRLISEKNVSTITRLTKPDMIVNFNNDFMGFDSAESKSEIILTGDECESIRSRYYAIQKDSADVQNAIKSKFTVMEQTNESIGTAIEHIKTLIAQVNSETKKIQKQLNKIYEEDDQWVIENNCHMFIGMNFEGKTSLKIKYVPKKTINCKTITPDSSGVGHSFKS